MKSIMRILYCGSLLLLSFFLTSCLNKTQSKESIESPQENIQAQNANDTSPIIAQPVSLPVKYQTPNYLVDQQALEDLPIAEEGKLKVGAKIVSTRGPQPLVDIMKRLTALKGMNVSWASDVDKNVLVDVNISADDDFVTAIDNLLRQVDYHHEMNGSTIIVKYKDTRQFHIAMPFIKQTYNTNTGGDVLGGSSSGESNTSVAGEISVKTEGVAINNLRDGTPGGIEFNIWNSIENNLNSILNIWSTDSIEHKSAQVVDNNITQSDYHKSKENIDSKEITDSTGQAVTATFRRSSGGNNYFIDKPVGLITVTAPRPLLEKLEAYFASLKKELYKQVAIEAKVIEVQLDDRSAIGLNWNLLLRNLSVSAGNASLGRNYSKTETDTTTSSSTQSNTFSDTSTTTRTRDRTFDNLLDDNLTGDTATNSFQGIVANTANSTVASGVSAATIISDGLTGGISGAISLAAFTFDSFLNAVSEQGQTTILSNPKLSVLNGQPALITVGRNVTYIKDITADVSSETGLITYSAETARALSGVGLALTANILDEKEVILNLVPVTSELVEPIEYRTIGLGEVGLPIINLREMSSTVRVKNGEMLVIGGLISSSAENEGTFLPGTRNLSFFKYLFGSEEKTSRKRELIILLKPKII